LGLESKCALLRNTDGTPVPLDQRTRAVYQEIARLEGRARGPLDESFQKALLDDGRVDWKCRAGARFFHVCDRGLVHFCGPRFGAPAVPLERYRRDDVRRAFDAVKTCAATCPVAYAHMVSRMDGWRAQSGPSLPPAAAKHLPVVRA
jgi:hypothetical protein